MACQTVTTKCSLPNCLRTGCLPVQSMCRFSKMDWAARPFSKHSISTVSARTPKMGVDQAPQAAQTVRRATTMQMLRRTTAAAWSLTSAGYAAAMALPKALATATAASWMRWAYAAVRALRMRTATAFATTQRYLAARTARRATTMRTLRRMTAAVRNWMSAVFVEETALPRVLAIVRATCWMSAAFAAVTASPMVRVTVRATVQLRATTATACA